MTTTPTLEDFQNFTTQHMEMMKTFTSTMTKGLQEIAAESTEYSKHAFASSSAVVEQLLGAKSVETAIAIQTEFAKSAYEGFVSKSTKINEILTKVAGEAMKPMQTALAAATTK